MQQWRALSKPERARWIVFFQIESDRLEEDLRQQRAETDLRRR